MRSRSDDQIRKQAQSLIDKRPEQMEISNLTATWTAWLTQVNVFINKLGDETMTHMLHEAMSRTRLSERLERYRDNRGSFGVYGPDTIDYWMADNIVGVLTGLIGAVDDGTFTELATRIASEIYSDVLAESEDLLKDQHLPCAAILARVGLENGLRQLATRHNVPLPARVTAGVVNDELRKANVPGYVLSTKQSVDGILAIGNAFAHNTPDAKNYKEADVKKMIDDVRHFLGRFGV